MNIKFKDDCDAQRLFGWVTFISYILGILLGIFLIGVIINSMITNTILNSAMLILGITITVFLYIVARLSHIEYKKLIKNDI